MSDDDLLDMALTSMSPEQFVAIQSFAAEHEVSWIHAFWAVIATGLDHTDELIAKLKNHEEFSA